MVNLINTSYENEHFMANNHDCDIQYKQHDIIIIIIMSNIL